MSHTMAMLSHLLHLTVAFTVLFKTKQKHVFFCVVLRFLKNYFYTHTHILHKIKPLNRIRILGPRLFWYFFLFGFFFFPFFSPFFQRQPIGEIQRQNTHKKKKDTAKHENNDKNTPKNKRFTRFGNKCGQWCNMCGWWGYNHAIFWWHCHKFKLEMQVYTMCNV